MARELPQDLPIKPFRDAPAFEAWIRAHPDAKGVWLKFAKKASGKISINYGGALDVALCYGWIDGQARSIDDQYYLQRFTPRTKSSLWSKRNVDKAEALIDAGRMTAAGLRAIDAAKNDGRWARAYHGPKTMALPVDLTAALAKNKKAREFFETINKANRFAVCFRIETAKKPETRAVRIEALVAKLARGELLHASSATTKRKAPKKKKK